MARFLILWRRSPTAAWPTNVAESAKLQEKFWVAIDNLVKKGEVKEFGWFLNGTSGYAMGETESAVVFKDLSMFVPWIECEVHEVISYDKGKETLRALWKALAEAMK